MFEFLKRDPKFDTFATTCESAEKILAIDPRQCAIACRTGLEFAVKWLYKNDDTLVMPYQHNLKSLVMASCFVEFIPVELAGSIKNIIDLGNFATHNPTKTITTCGVKPLALAMGSFSKKIFLFSALTLIIGLILFFSVNIYIDKSAEAYIIILDYVGGACSPLTLIYCD